jgi:two-component system sensor histidine kinase/response regulator
LLPWISGRLDRRRDASPSFGSLASAISEDAPTILAVDDHPANLLALEAVLQPLGYPIVSATSGEEALKRVGDHDFVLILMDVHMPGLDGYQTTALIRQRERSRDVPVIFITAVYNQPAHTHRGYALGAVDYITKPFDPEVLRGKVRALVLLYTRGQRAERERSQEAERIKDLFLGALGHDLRNPLNAIVLASQLMLRDADCGNAAHRAHTKTIGRAARRMHRMIEDILDLTRGQLAGGIPLSPQTTNLGDVCRGVVDECRLAHPERVLDLDISGNVCGFWDPDRLGRVVSNLVGNAAEHQDGPVHVRVSDRGERVVLEVQNGGTPIEPEVLPTLFEPFRRGDTGHDGLGLGLYIVREIVRAHDGSVDVSSTAADGTTFTVTLPKMARP